jgi:hypothetical protein
VQLQLDSRYAEFVGRAKPLRLAVPQDILDRLK